MTLNLLSNRSLNGKYLDCNHPVRDEPIGEVRRDAWDRHGSLWFIYAVMSGVVELWDTDAFYRQLDG